MRLFSHIVIRWASLIALVGTLLGFVGGYYSVQLYKNLRTDIEELLPTTARSVIDLNEVTHRLESIDSLAVLIFSEDAAQGKRFVQDLVGKLEKVPHDVIASVEYQIGPELQFFKKRQALYMEVADLEKIRDYIRDRIEYEKELYNPLNIFKGEEIPEPTLDFQALRQKYQTRVSSFERFPEGYYATPSGKTRVVLVYMPGKTSGIGQVHRIKDAVAKAVAELNPKTYSADMQIRYTGGIQDTLEEHQALIADLELSTVVVIILVTAAMWAFFRATRATIALVFSLFMGTAWTFGLSYFLVGYLNANSAFLGSIVIGNGINFGIIILARYLEERRQGISNTRAVHIAISHTATSTWTAALAAGLSYGSLMLTGFRGFNQFGTIGLVGMVLCWISAFTLLPAYLTVLDRFYTLIRPNRKVPKSYLSGGVAMLIDRFPKLIWGISLAITLLSLSTLVRYKSGILETNLGKLRNKESIERGSAYLSKYLDEIFQHYLSPLVILPRSREDTQRIAELLKQRKEKEGKHSLIASVQTLDDFVPQDQHRKIKILKEIKAMLPPRLLYRLSESDQKLIAQFMTPESFKPIHQSDMPALVLKKFTEKDGSVGKLVLVEPPLDKQTWEGENLIRFISELREVTDSVAPGAPVAGTLAITGDMITAISRDGPRATLFALVSVIVLVVFLFRNVQTITLVLFALFLGVIWLTGIILGFDLKINFLNFIALPITFGIGVDYGVNVFQRYRQEGGRNILRVIRNTGGAVGLCSFTTIVGYMSLLIAGNQGFVSFGALAVAGEITCVIAAVISLPAYLLLRDRRRLPGN